MVELRRALAHRSSDVRCAGNVQELCLAIVLLAAAVGGVEYVATVAVGWTTKLVQVDDLEDMLDLDLDQGDLELDGDVVAADSEAPSAPSAPTGSH